MAKKREREADDLSKIRVKLKPFLGMQPGLYLTILYAFVVALILFLFLFYPGIRRFGSELSITTTPPGAAVFVDGRYVGATPVTAFVTAGSHTLEVQKPYYASIKQPLSIDGRLFGSLFAPRRAGVALDLRIADLSGLLAHAFGEVSRWALVDTVVPNYQLPPVLTHTVRDAAESKGFRDYAALSRFLTDAARDVHNPYLLRDFVSAEGFLYARGDSLTPSSLLAMAADFAREVRANPQLVLWASASLPEAIQAKIHNQGWFKEIEKSYLDSLRAGGESTGATSAPPLALEGVRFIPVPEGSYIMGLARGQTPSDPAAEGLDLPHRVRVASFSMAVTDVTDAQFARFLAENPKWSPVERETLRQEGLVSSDYLKDWETVKGSDYPVTYVSSYAAQAYADWLTSKLPGYLSGWKVRLPSEEEYEWAARMNVNPRASAFRETVESLQRAASGAPSSLGIYDLLGNAWEWCDNWYFPASYLLTPWRGDRRFEGVPFASGAEKAIRGGSWASSRESVSYTTRASQPPTWCTPFLSFRPVLVRK